MPSQQVTVCAVCRHTHTRSRGTQAGVTVLCCVCFVRKDNRIILRKMMMTKTVMGIILMTQTI